MSSVAYWLWLSAATNASSRAKAALIEHYGDAETAYFAPDGEFSGINGISKTDAAILEKRDLRRVNSILEKCAAENIRIVTMQDAAYPDRLKNIFAPPPVLYVKGSLPALDDEAAIAVIGTRRASPYGLKMGRNLAYQICRCGGVIVSGLTAGVDAAAAKGALMAGGVCIGILGTSIDAEKGELAADVAASGALVSEYAPGTTTMRSFFRERNRIAAGLSVGVVVVEAPEKSGTKLFADEAAEQGKEIFAVPGNADAANSVGTIRMLKEGAKPVTCGWDVMSEFAALYPEKIKYAGAQSAPREAEPSGTRSESVQKRIDKAEASGYIDLHELVNGLNEDEKKIVAYLGKGRADKSELAAELNIPMPKMLTTLTMLMVKGKIRDAGNNCVALNLPQSEEK